MGIRGCDDCHHAPVMRCARCSRTQCAQHALAAGERCTSCESDWADEVTTRRAAKVIFVPPVALFAGGLLFVLLLPVSLGGALGATLMAALVTAITVGTGVGACALVDRSARARFLLESARALPAARLLPSGRR